MREASRVLAFHISEDGVVWRLVKDSARSISKKDHSIPLMRIENDHCVFVESYRQSVIYELFNYIIGR